MKVIYEIGHNDGLHIKYPIISSHSARSVWAKTTDKVFKVFGNQLSSANKNLRQAKNLLRFAQSKNWLHTQRRRRRNSCHPSKLVRWARLWATFGHSLAPPPTHTHTERALHPLYPVPLLSVPLYTSLPTHRDLPYHTKSALYPVYLYTLPLPCSTLWPVPLYLCSVCT